MAAPNSPPSLPLFPLPHPLVLFPSSRITVPVSKDSGRALISLIQDSPGQPLIAAVPILQPPPDGTKAGAIIQDAAGGGTVLNEWGCAAQVVRLVRPSALQPAQPYLLTLEGVTRIRLEPPLPSVESLDAVDFTFHPVVYPATRGLPLREHVESFKTAGVRLLDRMSKDVSQGNLTGKKEVYRRLRDTLEDVSDNRASMFADSLVGLIDGEFADKLDFLAAVDPSTRLQKAATIFTKQASISEVSSKISAAVHDSLSKQQKEYFLRQQLIAIQRELNALHRNSVGNGKRSGSASSSEDGGRSELDDDDTNEAEDMADIRRKIEAMEVGSEERKTGVREWRRLKRIPQGSVEHGVIRNYLEHLTELPWSSSTTTSQSLETLKDRAFLRKARAQLDNDHYGLDKVKRRLIEYLAVVRLKATTAALQQAEHDAKSLPSVALVKKGDVDVPVTTPPPPKSIARKTGKKVANKGPILLFVGPPGVGKTSLGLSIAHALDRPFQRISLGGVRDEAEIRGHRRTYVASGPGLIVQALRRAGRPDFVCLLDEIDKVGGGRGGVHGDPGAALLEVLDPEQNGAFNDHYINVPVDLSQVLFICTSNSLDTISAPLLDRCEIIQLSGYTHAEKIHIARHFLLPKQLTANGLTPSHITLTSDALMCIATRYTREAGVRSLERAIGAVVRFKAVEWADCMDSKEDNKNIQGKTGKEVAIVSKEYKPEVREEDLEAILGIARWEEDERDREERRGVVYGLVVMGQGEGGILPVETIAVPGSGGLKLTGSLGEVIRESAEIALSWVKRHAYALCVTSLPSQDPLKIPDPIDVHLHLPAGGQRKDGPSAGIAMVCALVSLLTGATVPPNIAMTGEVTLRGRVTPVGGIKEKVLGAHRASIKKIILPAGNRKDVEHDVPREVKEQMEFIFVSTLQEALSAAFGPDGLEWRRAGGLQVESRL
ncbi:ATP-dependent protease La [Hysterangium stoloniferum]|nr:ATP-dependent protease La [Hysterangium stoloniferum]